MAINTEADVLRLKADRIEKGNAGRDFTIRDSRKDRAEFVANRGCPLAVEVGLQDGGIWLTPAEVAQFSQLDIELKACASLTDGGAPASTDAVLASKTVLKASYDATYASPATEVIDVTCGAENAGRQLAKVVAVAEGYAREDFTITTVAGSSITDGAWFDMSVVDATQQAVTARVWFDLNGAGASGPPATPAGGFVVACEYVTADTAEDIATLIHEAFRATATIDDYLVTTRAGSTLTCKNQLVDTVASPADIVDGATGTGFALVTTRQGATGPSAVEGTWFDIEDEDGPVRVWLAVNSNSHLEPNGTAPLAPVGGRNIKVSGPRTGKIMIKPGLHRGDTAAEVAAAIAAELNNDSKFTASANGSTLLIRRADGNGITTIADGPGLTATGFALSVPQTLDGYYFDVADEAGPVRVWFDVDDDGTAAPAPPASGRLLEITGVAAGDTNTLVATALESELGADGKFSASRSGAVVTLTCASSGDRTDPVDAGTNFSFAVTTQGASDTTITDSLWATGSGVQHAKLVFGNAEMNQASGYYWLILTGTPTGGDPVTLTAGRIYLREDGITAGAPSAPSATGVKTTLWDFTITSLTGGTAADLDGRATVAGAIGVNTVYGFYNEDAGMYQQWHLLAGTDAEDVSIGIVRPDDYATTTNEKIWRRAM